MSSTPRPSTPRPSTSRHDTPTPSSTGGEHDGPTSGIGGSPRPAGPPGNTALRNLRLARHWTQADFTVAFEAKSRELGRTLSLSVRQVRRWESENPPCPLPAYQRVLEALFGVAVTDMGFRPSWSVPWAPGIRQESGPYPRIPAPAANLAAGSKESEERYDPVNRRDFVASAVAIGAAPLLTTAERPAAGGHTAAGVPAVPGTAVAGRAPAAPGGGALDAGTVQGYAAITSQQRAMYWTIPAARMFPPVAAHAQLGIALLRNGPARLAHRQRLAGAVAETSMLAARIAFFDLQAPQDARRYYQVALAAARDASDHQLGSAILAHLAFIPAYAGEAGEARDLMRAAHAYAARGVSTTHRAWLYAVEAETETRLGAPSRAVTLIGRSSDTLYGPGRGDVPEWLDFFDGVRMTGFRGFCELSTGRPDQACVALQETLDRLPANAGKQRAIVLADLAEGFRQRDEVDEACRMLDQALDGLEQHWYATAMDRVRTVRARLAGQQSSNSVRELDGRLAEWRRALPAGGSRLAG
jgi:tetratricopeptide (TPR) repeat protein/transcriptional regulator with XRE-family HTH domain